jgi:hypothetical protein
MRSFFPHVEACLEKYGTVGLFAEDYLEVIHALANHIVAEFQSLGVEITHAMKHQRREMVKKEEMIAQGKIVKVEKRKRQGTGAHEKFRVEHTLLDEIPDSHKYYEINGLRELPQFDLYLSLNSAKLAWTL